MAGYSGTPLPKKLGIKPGHRVLLINAPPEYPEALGDVRHDVTFETRAAGKPFDVILLFVDAEATLARRFDQLAKRLATNGGLWVAWPKKASGVATDLSDNVVRRIGLDAGLVDNKVCAVDETWSGLRFVIRLRDRR